MTAPSAATPQTDSQCRECGKLFRKGRKHQESCDEPCRKARWARLNPKLRDVLDRLSPPARAEAEAILRFEELRPTPAARVEATS